MTADKKFYETPEFKKLQTKWYARIKKKGFVDIEEGQDERIVEPEVFNTETNQYHHGIEYYELCLRILAEGKFRKEIYKLIFELHTEGKSEREIAGELEKLDAGLTPQAVSEIIKRIKKNFLRGIKVK